MWDIFRTFIINETAKKHNKTPFNAIQALFEA